MQVIILIMGLLLVALGFLTKAYPNLIPGYNAMPEERKKKVDVDGLSSFMRNGLVVMGLITIIGYFLFNWTGQPGLARSMAYIPTISGAIVLVVVGDLIITTSNENKFLPLHTPADNINPIFSPGAGKGKSGYGGIRPIKRSGHVAVQRCSIPFTIKMKPMIRIATKNRWDFKQVGRTHCLPAPDDHARKHNLLR